MPPPEAPLAELVAGASAPAPGAGWEDAYTPLAAALAAAKSALDPYEGRVAEEFLAAADLLSGLKRRIRAEFGAQAATNAWLKMAELAREVPLPAAAGRLTAFHNAELPGAFIAALNHAARTAAPPLEYDWVAASFAPDAEGALGDAFGFRARNPDRWLMGPAATGPSGDLTDPAAVAALAAAVERRYPGGVDLYTADAGCDVSGDYNRQEELTAPLHFGAALCGLLALRAGGAFVSKLYTWMRPFTRSLIAALAALFDELRIVKPAASRPTNSEVYLVGRGYRRAAFTPAVRAEWEARLAACRGRPEALAAGPPLLREGGAPGAEAALLRAARRLFGRTQVAFLREAVDFMAGREACPARRLRGLLAPAALEAQEAWLARARLAPLPPEERVPGAPEPDPPQAPEGGALPGSGGVGAGRGRRGAPRGTWA